MAARGMYLRARRNGVTFQRNGTVDGGKRPIASKTLITRSTVRRGRSVLNVRSLWSSLRGNIWSALIWIMADQMNMEVAAAFELARDEWDEEHEEDMREINNE